MIELGVEYQFVEDYGAFSRHINTTTGESIVAVRYLLPDASAQPSERKATQDFIELISSVSYLAIPTPITIIETDTNCYLIYTDNDYKSLASIVSPAAGQNAISETTFWEICGELVSTLLHLRTCLAGLNLSFYLEYLSLSSIMLGADYRPRIFDLTCLKCVFDDSEHLFPHYREASTAPSINFPNSVLEYCEHIANKDANASLRGSELNDYIAQSLGSVLYYLTTGTEFESHLLNSDQLEHAIMNVGGASSERKALLLGLLNSSSIGQPHPLDLYEVYCICCQQIDKQANKDTQVELDPGPKPASDPVSKDIVDTIESLRVKNAQLEGYTSQIMNELKSKMQEVSDLRAQLAEALKQGEAFAEQLPLFQKEISMLKKKLIEKSAGPPSPRRDDLEDEIAALREELSKAYTDLQVEVSAREELERRLQTMCVPTADTERKELEILREKVLLLQEKIQDRDDLITSLYTSLHSSESIKLPVKALDLVPPGVRAPLPVDTLELPTADATRQEVDVQREELLSVHIGDEAASVIDSTSISDSHGTRRQLTEISAMMAAHHSPTPDTVSPSIDAQISSLITNSVQRMPISAKRGDELNIKDLELNDPSRGVVSVPNRSRSTKTALNNDTHKAKQVTTNYNNNAVDRVYSKSAKRPRAKTPSPKVDTHQFLKARSPTREQEVTEKLIECKLPNQIIRLKSELTPADRLMQKFDYNSEYIIKSGEKNYTPLMEVICNNRQPRAAGSKSVINFKNYTAYIGQQNEQGLTALMIASMKNNEHAVKFLVKHEANLLTVEGYSALYLALLSNHIGIARLILPYEGFAYEEDQQELTKDGMTHLMMAALSNDIIKAFIYLDSQKGKQNASGYTALMLAAERGNAEICQLLVSEEKCIKNNESETALMLAAKYGHKNCVRILATSEKGLQNKKGQTALMLASIAGYHELVNILINSEAGRNAYVFDKETGYTALIYAIKYRHKECIEKLAQREGRKPDMRGNTPRMFASTNDILKLCQLLGIQ